MATDRPSLPGLRDSNALGAASVARRAPRSCWDGFTKTGDDCPGSGLRSSGRWLREMAAGDGVLVTGSTGFPSGCAIAPRDSTLRGTRAPVPGFGEFGTISGARRSKVSVLAETRVTGAIIVFLS